MRNVVVTRRVDPLLPNLRSGEVRRCSEKTTPLRGLFWDLAVRKRIFSSHKQTLIAQMWCPDVPLLIYKSIYYSVYQELL
jgi:hypothetical protein